MNDESMGFEKCVAIVSYASAGSLCKSALLFTYYNEIQ